LAQASAQAFLSLSASESISEIFSWWTK